MGTTETETVALTFNRNPLDYAGDIEQPDASEVKTTPSLWNASLEDALLYGGDLTRAALGAMNLYGDKRFTIVDTKVHMLAPGQYPALPGWHTDGTPRLSAGFTLKQHEDYTPAMLADEGWLHPQHKGLPVIRAQEHLDSPRFHLLVTGEGCLTEFVRGEVDVPVPALPDRGLYAGITRQVREMVEEGAVQTFEVPSCRAVEWDWWTLHQAKAAERVEWRFLIRVTESDHNEPQTDLRKVLRVQNQVFVPTLDTGW